MTTIGTAPITEVTSKNLNKPVLCNTYEEAVSVFGNSKDFESYTLCEAIDAHFSKFNVGPIVLINVLDPTRHNVASSRTLILDSNLSAILPNGVIPASIEVTSGIKRKFLMFKNEDGTLKISFEGASSGERIDVSFTMLKPDKVTTDDIIGGIDSSTGKNKGIECLEDVFPLTRKVPTLVLAPKFSSDNVVANVLESKAKLINGHFKALALVDLDTKIVKKYSDASGIKETNNLNSTNLVVNYPKVALGEQQYHLSTQVACLIQQLASESGGIPYKSPSNINIKADRTCLADGTDILLAINQANYLNENGINTAINWIGGWRAWGNRTSCYPAVMDAKDNFIVSRLMFNFLNNTLITNFWDKVDKPTNQTLIKTLKDSINIWLNGLQASGVLIGGRIEFRQEDNPLTSLLDGKVKFKIYFTPALPMESAEFDCEIDTNYYNNLFA